MRGCRTSMSALAIVAACAMVIACSGGGNAGPGSGGATWTRTERTAFPGLSWYTGASLAVTSDGREVVGFDGQAAYDAPNKPHVHVRNGAGWTELAGLLRNSAHAAWEAPRVAVEGDGSIVAALEENFDPSGIGTVELYVARWSGSAWTPLGGALNTAGTIPFYTRIAASPSGTLVAWYEESSSLASAPLRVARWSGSGWEDLGSASAGTTWAPALGAAGSTPLVATIPTTHYAYAFRWQSSAWAMLPTTSLATTYGDVVSISGDADGTIYVGVGDVGGALTCLRLPASGVAWQTLPVLPDNVWLGTFGQTQAAYPGGGFVTTFAGQHVYVTRWTGQAWQTIDDDAGQSYDGKWPQVAVAPGGSVHVAWFEGNFGAALRVAAYTP